MDVKAEAQRVMAVALSKMYSGRLQRGGARLHRSLLLSLVLRGAQDVYLGLRTARELGPEESSGARMEVESGVGGADAPGKVRAPSPAQGIEFMDCSAQPVTPEESQVQRIESAGRLECMEPAERIDSEGVLGQCIQLGESDSSGTPCDVSEPESRGQKVPVDKQLVPRPDRSRKRRKGCSEPEALPTKRARLEKEEETHVLAASLGSGLPVKVKEQPVSQGQIWRDRISMWVRPIVAY